MVMTPSGFGAVLFGWFTAEIGRQPFVVYGLLRTADAVSPVTARRGARPRSSPSSSSTPSSSASAATTSRSSCGKGPEPLEEAVRGADFGDRADKKAKRPLSVPDESLAAVRPPRRSPLERDFSSSRHPALPLCSSMIFAENR